LRDKTIPNQLINNWDAFKKWTEDQKQKRKDRNLELRQREKSLIYDDEPSISQYVDSMMGGWKGCEEYWNRFEPMVCNLNSKSAFTKDQLSSKDAQFVHML